MSDCVVTLRGQFGFQLVLAASGYEYPGSTEGVDADWIAGYVAVERGDGFDVSARLAVSWRAEEFEAFAAGLEQLVRTGSGRAQLQHIEQQVSVNLRPGRVSGYVTDGSQVRIGFTDVRMGETDLKSVYRQLRVLTNKFPSRCPL